MGRVRTKNRHLPARMYLEHGAYWFREPGKKRVNLGRDLSEAMALYASMIGNSWAGRTVGDCIDRYRSEVLPLKRSKQTREDQSKQLERLKNGFGHFLPQNVKPKHCYRYADKRLSKDGKRVPVAARHEISLLGHVFTMAIIWGLIDVNPISGLRLLRKDKAIKKRQVHMWEVEALKKLANPRMAAAIDLACNIGQRRGDLLTLKHSDLDEELHIEQSKTGARIDMERTARLNEIVATLKAFKPDIPNIYLIRQRNGQPYTDDGFSSNWQRLMRKYAKVTGNPRFKFHWLRSVAADTGTIEEARARLGHTTTSTTRRFYRQTAEKAKPRE